jgi:hypothetical protein
MWKFIPETFLKIRVRKSVRGRILTALTLTRAHKQIGAEAEKHPENV